MSKRFSLSMVAILLLAGLVMVALIFDWGRSDSMPPDLPLLTDTGNTLEKINLIQVNYPKPGTLIDNPVTITGQARGSWFFEASFPVEIRDANGTLLALVPAQALGEWMTVDFVPFSVGLAFASPQTATGTLIFRKDNPSGLPENEDSLYFPIIFQN